MNAPETPREANARGMACLNTGEYAQAIAAFAAAAAADPHAGPLWRNLAHAHRLAGDVQGERQALDRAIAIDRLDFAAQLRSAQWYERHGPERAALESWDGVLQLAERMPGQSPQLVAELDAGRTLRTRLRQRIEAAGEQALATQRNRFSQTDARRLDAFVDLALGKRRIFHNECAGVHYPFLPEDEFFDSELFPSFVELEAATRQIRAELDDLLQSTDEVLRPYVRLEDGTPNNPWSALDGSLDWGACFLWEYGVPNRPVLERCPQTAALLDRLPLARIPGRAPNAFFSLLKPGSRIPPHTGVTNTRAIVHLALDVPPYCGFRVGNEVREWVEGKAFAFDDTIEHEAWNNSTRLRSVLIVDYWNPHLSPVEQDALIRYFAAADEALPGAA